MNHPYKFQYRRRFFWKKITAIGHGYIPEQDKMVVYLVSGAIREIKNWKNHEIYLGEDWVISTKKSLEQKAGQPISLAVG